MDMNRTPRPDQPDQLPPALTPRALSRPAPESEVVASLKVSCEGDEARGLGHPRVWLSIPPEAGFADCGYCDKRFIYDPEAAGN